MTRFAEMVEHAKAHHAADMLIKGTYVDEEAKTFRGCSVGCFLHDVYPKKSKSWISSLGDKHTKVADHYGYPAWLAYLQDVIFEGLPNGESASWHVELAETLASLPADYDWSAALHRVHVAILRVSYQTAGSAQQVVQNVIDLHERAASGEDVSDEQWSAARAAADSASESAARSAIWSAAESAAWSAAWSAARSAAESAAWSAAESAAESAAWSAALQEIRDGVIQALRQQVAS